MGILLVIVENTINTLKGHSSVSYCTVINTTLIRFYAVHLIIL